MEEKKTMNFLELETAEEANKVDMNKYRFERFSEKRGMYLFVKRAE